MKQVVLGTAGHIDHGKTTLIKALSGIDTDRLKEEKKRGITIELGFAYLELPGGQLLGIVDVPGHEKFVKNMVAGATGIDLVALIVAADEGVMPQTREHVEVCELLGIRHGLTVLTKIDMVDAEWLELVREDLGEYLSGTFLGDSPVVEVSAITGQGLEELKTALKELVQQIPERQPGHIFRIPVDRVFTMRGFGTVITGTTVSGSIRTGDGVTIYPEELDAKIRGIQVHGREREQVSAGLRTAINLQGVDKASIRRGDVVASEHALRPTYMVDVILELLPAAPRKLKNRGKARFHTGTCESICTVVLLDRDELKPGEQCFAQIRLDAPTAVLKQDRYVLRSYSPVRTIGGGVVLNPLPRKKKRFSESVISEMEVLHGGSLQEIVELFVTLGRFQGSEEKDLNTLANTSKKQLDEVLNRLKSEQKIIAYDKDRGSLIHADFLEEAKREILETISRYHEQFPLKTGLPKEELRTRTIGSKNPKLFNYVINQLGQAGTIVQEKDLVRHRDHQVKLKGEQESTRRELENIYLKSGLQPPYFKEIKRDFPGRTASEVLEVMLKEGVLVKVKEDLFFHHSAVEALREKLVDFIKTHGEITTPQFKDLTGTSRKYTIPLIEYFDATHLTVRVGDSRVLRRKQENSQ